MLAVGSGYIYRLSLLSPGVAPAAAEAGPGKDQEAGGLVLPTAEPTAESAAAASTEAPAAVPAGEDTTLEREVAVSLSADPSTSSGSEESKSGSSSG